MFKNVLYDLREANNLIEIVKCVNKISEYLGFEWITYCSGGEPSQIFTTYPNSWIDYYKEKNFHLSDPVCHLARQASSHLFWNYSELKNMEKLETGSEKYINEALAFGIHSGVSIQICPNTNNSKGVITLSKKINSAHSDLKSIEFPFLREWGLLLEKKLQSFMPKFQKKNALTNRQEEFLYEVSQGKSAKLIALQNGISYRTVEYHLEEAKKRLNASTITQAAVIMLTNRV